MIHPQDELPESVFVDLIPEIRFDWPALVPGALVVLVFAWWAVGR